MPRAAAAGHADKPKGRTTAYAFFMKLMSEEQRKKNQSVAFTELTKMCSERWKNMSESEKHKFQVMANEDKVRYDNEMMGYVPGPTDTKTSSKRKKKDPNAPKRAMSAFFWFSHDERAKIKVSNPGRLAVADVSKELGRRWAQVSAADKHHYQKLADKDKLRYEKEMAAYRAKIKATNHETDENDGENDTEEDE
ncbi:unnamed protein product [Notodromas monacha]|uniref:HMG box domain-containing protein n=1 Tax=Notodromas monacha TaxID=399045 RepID=A0A7R9BS23_9CRUS|nr:unnamed protein product [Notodromas monacha]CAG0919138.1 unnamed protein product [Notodromas monacha]